MLVSEARPSTGFTTNWQNPEGYLGLLLQHLASPWRRTWQTTPVFLPVESPWTKEPGGILSIELQRVGHNWGKLEQNSTWPLTYMIRLWQSLSDLTSQFLVLFQSLLIRTKFTLSHKNLMNQFMTIRIHSRLFLKKFLIFLQMLFPLR